MNKAYESIDEDKKRKSINFKEYIPRFSTTKIKDSFNITDNSQNYNNINNTEKSYYITNTYKKIIKKNYIDNIDNKNTKKIKSLSHYNLDLNLIIIKIK